MEKKAVFELNAVVRIAGLLILALFLFAGCDDEDEGPTGFERVAWDCHQPVLEGNKLHATVFAGESEGWLVGAEGTILYSSDGGDTWDYQPSGTNEDLWDVAFFDADTGWAVGDNGRLMRTTNGGAPWLQTQFDTITSHIYSVAFEDGQNGWAVGQYGAVVRTIDGGRSWVHDITSGSEQTLRGLALFGNVALAVGDAGTVLRATKDGVWSDWSASTIGSNALWAVTLVDANTGWAVGENGAIRMTTDGGVTWAGGTGYVSGTLTDVVFADATTGLAVGSDGAILSTSDGGQNWTVDTITTWHDLSGVCFAGQNEAWAVGSLTIIHSTNAGSSWSAEPSGTAPYVMLRDITFVNEDLGWAVGNAGTILKTADGGDTWEYQKHESVYNLADVWYYDVMFVDSLNGWCAGGKGESPPYTGILLRTSDGGRSWSAQSFDSTNWLYGITFVDSLTGWAVGGDWGGGQVGGIVLWTIDGGLNWEELSGSDLPTVDQLEDVTFIDALNGWVIGRAATILRTTDGGATWVGQYLEWECTKWQFDSPTDSTCIDSMLVTPAFAPILYAAAATDSLHCWVVGKEGAILHTTDGGTIWQQQSSGTIQDLCAVTFLNSTTGWVIGAEGIILYTDDGGATWNVQPSGTGDDLLGVEFIDSDNGWIVGGDEDGNDIILLSTTTGGR